ncbi:MAG: ATP-binding cassette domain-containing protein [Clostridiales bacterium]|nr:ATP-binding cassette domain-containing protein [Clostridiales bacterium]
MIQVDNLTKLYGEHVAVDKASFTVNKGEILGFLGPNGAGKSTVMNIITGYISATEGSVTVAGYDILDNPQEAKQSIGYLPEFPPLYGDMTVMEYLGFVSDIKKIAKKEKKQNIQSVLELVRIADVKDRLVKNLSKGYRQRVGLAQAILGGPDILILDEPTVGLDPKQIIEMRSLIKSLGKEHTVILSSHILPEVSAVCDRVIIIDKGKIVASDTPDRLSKRIGDSSRLSLRVAGAERQVVKLLSDIPGIKEVGSQGSLEADTVDIIVEAEKDIDIRRPVFNGLSKAGYAILSMTSMDPTLEDIFLYVTTEEEEVS